MTTDAEARAAARAEDLHREYGRGSAAVHALRGVSVTLAPGTFTAVMGPSGSGKTTLLSVRDDGRGGAALGTGTGLTGLAERLAAVDGALRVDSPPGGPTVVTAELPTRLC
ncbi:ATP-binding cassette domain-containing protein [Streptomyces sp. DSM 110735]|uniref:ATP-binding cassette domain-containing protein n=1 Tax=Streptomyces sp. DSM 110735 TaxID=2775031 RepID=UPI0035A885B8